jgi:phage terminase large subunit-like protein
VTGDERALLRAVRRLAGCDAAARRAIVARLSGAQKRTLDQFWPAWAHDGQTAPAGQCPTWTILAGRGFGKTRAGAEWVSDIARRHGAGTRIALVGATIEDVRKVMVGGESGILAVARTGEAVRFARTEGVVRFASGAEAFAYSGACPDKLRGPQHHFAWCDEIAKWRHAEESWDNLQLGLRLGGEGVGAGPRSLVTTTPKAVPMLRRLIAGGAVTGGRTRDNPHLPPAFVARMEAEYRGTRKGREELDGELIEDVEGALWSRAVIERWREGPPPAPPATAGGGRYARIVIGVDPPATAHGDACGIVACALGADPKTGQAVGYVIGDHTVRGLSPEGWAAKVVAAAEAWGADCVVVECNQGGEMPISVLKTADPELPVRPVRARYGKGDRAEPVAMLFEKGEARFAGTFPELEDELCALTRGGGYAGPGRSPDRADAMVWAMTELMLGRPRREVRVRQL